MSKQIWTNGDKQIEIENGIITASNSASYPVGQKVDFKRMRACGWIKQTSPKPSYIKGFNGNAFNK